MQPYLIHPAIIHFPIVLILCGACASLYYAFGAKAHQSQSLWLTKLCIWSGSGFALISFAIGLLAQNQFAGIESEIAIQAIADHKFAALIALGGCALASLWLVADHANKLVTKKAYFIMACLAAGLICWTAFLGGKLVYEHHLPSLLKTDLKSDAVLPAPSGLTE